MSTPTKQALIQDAKALLAEMQEAAKKTITSVEGVRAAEEKAKADIAKFKALLVKIARAPGVTEMELDALISQAEELRKVEFKIAIQGKSEKRAGRHVTISTESTPAGTKEMSDDYGNTTYTVDVKATEGSSHTEWVFDPHTVEVGGRREQQAWYGELYSSEGIQQFYDNLRLMQKAVDNINLMPRLELLVKYNPEGAAPPRSMIELQQLAQAGNVEEFKAKYDALRAENEKIRAGHPNENYDAARKEVDPAFQLLYLDEKSFAKKLAGVPDNDKTKLISEHNTLKKKQNQRQVNPGSSTYYTGTDQNGTDSTFIADAIEFNGKFVAAVENARQAKVEAEAKEAPAKERAKQFQDIKAEAGALGQTGGTLRARVEKLSEDYGAKSLAVLSATNQRKAEYLEAAKNYLKDPDGSTEISNPGAGNTRRIRNSERLLSAERALAEPVGLRGLIGKNTLDQSSSDELKAVVAEVKKFRGEMKDHVDKVNDARLNSDQRNEVQAEYKGGAKIAYDGASKVQTRPDMKNS